MAAGSRCKTALAAHRRDSAPKRRALLGAAPGHALLRRYAGVRIYPVGDADLVFRFGQRFAKLKPAFGGEIKVVERIRQTGERAVFPATRFANPEITVRATLKAGVAKVGQFVLVGR